MLLGTLFLILWDYKKLGILFKQDHQIKIDLTNQAKDNLMTDPVWTIAGVSFVALTVGVQMINPNQTMILAWVITMLLVGIAAFIVGLLRYKSAKNKLSD